MKKISLFLIVFSSFFLVHAQKNLLSGKYTREELTAILIPQAKWIPFPKLNDRNGWSKADQEMMKAYLKAAELNINYVWPYVPATKSLLIERTGDREEYQNIAREKRNTLGIMLLEEIYENKGRFIDPILNGVWSICEESFWGVPAHLPKTKEY